MDARRRVLDVVQQVCRKGLVVGICGGMQMIRREITDPLGMEREGSIAGLGLLPIKQSCRRKVTRNAAGEMTAKILFGQTVTVGRVSGYEIHIGRTIYQPECDTVRGLLHLAAASLDRLRWLYSR